MERLAKWIVEKRRRILSLFLLLTLVSGWLMTEVSVNYDMSYYLPADSAVRQGTSLMQEEFPPEGSIRVMLGGLDATAQETAHDRLMEIEYITHVGMQTAGENTLYHLTIGVDIFSDAGRQVQDEISAAFTGYDLTISSEAAMPVDILMIALPAILILLVIFFIMCNSWFEPVIFLINIGVAIVINMGTNIIFPSVSDVTVSIAAILQLVLSMDYSIIFLDRYRLEKAQVGDKYIAMQNTLKSSFTTISSIAVTTIVGMAMLTLMSFAIGRDFGLVIAKGVLISLLCVFAVMPPLILRFDALLEKTIKPALPLRMDKLSTFNHRGRVVTSLLFLALFVAAFFIRGNIEITYSIADYDPIHQAFELENPIVILYENADETQMEALTQTWAERAEVTQIQSYARTLGQQMPSPEEVATLAQMAPDQLAEMLALYEEGRGQFVGENFSRLILQTNLPVESEETFAFLRSIMAEMTVLDGAFYVIGESAMAYEMSQDFPRELDRITILTTIAFFLVVLLSFRKLSLAIILVAVIQSAVFITMAAAYFQDGGIMYLPLIIAQCLLKGRVIDYGILYTANYMEAREKFAVPEAMIQAMNHSIHTIATSSFIIIGITGIMGVIYLNINGAIADIMLLVALGCLIGALITVFFLPGLIAVFDKFVSKKKKGHLSK